MSEISRWSRALIRFRSWLDPRQQCPDDDYEDDYYDLDVIAGRFLGDYDDAVNDGATREELARIVTGLAGCELAMSYASGACRPLGWIETDEESLTRQRYRRSGLLLLEVAYAATDGRDYQGVREYEFGYELGAVADALRELAVAFALRDENGASSDLVGQRLRDLFEVVPDEVLVSLMRAHGYDAAPAGAASEGGAA